MLPPIALMLPLLAPALAQDSSGPVPAGMLRYPDVSSTHIVFSYANDLWLVPRDGGVATPLVSPAGSERFPRFSADGQAVAFVGNYEGDTDLYTISLAGGFAERVTHHPSNETLCEWMPNGDLLYFANGQAGLQRQSQVFTVSSIGGMPTTLPIPYGTFSSIDESGTWLAYTPRTRDNRTWKRYRGGLATDIWLFNLKDHSAKKVTDWEGTDTQPMWWKGKLYYLSDAGPEHRMNIWRLDPDGGAPKQITKFADNDIKWPSMGPGNRGQGEIVFQLGHDLKLLDLKSGKDTTVEVIVPGERSNLRPRVVDASQFISSWTVSPNAKRAAVSARGDIWSLPSEKGVPINLTHSNATAERSPAWSPDGQWIAYFSDQSGEYELWMTQSDGRGETKQLTNAGGVFKLGMLWSPDSKSIAYVDSDGTLHLYDMESNTTKVVDTSPFGFWIGSIGGVDWSADSRWLAYSRAADDNAQTSIWIYDTTSGESHQVTSGFFADNSPAFDREGKYLYFASSRRFSPTYSDIDSSFIYEDSQVLVAVPLLADSERLWAPEHDVVSWEEDGDEEEEETDEEGEGAEEEEGAAEGDASGDDGVTGSWSGSLSADVIPEDMPITFDLVLNADNSLSGSVTAPMGNASVTSGTYNPDSGAVTMTLATDDGGSVSIQATIDGNVMEGKGVIEAEGLEFTFRLERSSSGQDGGSDGDGGSDEVADEVLIDFEGFEARAFALPVPNGNFGNLMVNDKNQLLYARRGSSGGIKLFDLHEDNPSEKDVSGGGGFLLSANGKKLLSPRGRAASILDAKAGASGKNVPTEGMQVRIHPSEEYPQLFTDAWRIFRDYFYDPNMHGVDWQAVHDHYAAMIPFCSSREDLTYLIGEVIAEANVGHAYLAGNGDGSPGGPSTNVGMLGVDFELNNGAYQIARILRGAAWDTDALGPLSAAGVDVYEGDYLLAVNGRPLDPTQDPWAAFVGLGGKEVVLTVSAEPTMSEASRDVIVKTLTNDSNLRYRAWIEKNRRYVEEMSGGRLGYIYVPDTGVNGQNNLFRQFYGQILKDGLIIDERWNGGGQIPTRFIELLNRPATNYWATRGAKDIHWPPDSHQGLKCMLINEDAGSGGDAFPSYFRQAGLGKLIGRRTWGGLVGISGNPGLIDGGGITVPTFAFYDNDGTWGVEGHGVDPDIEVMDDPSKMVDGGDPQLDVAIEHMMERLATEAYRVPKRPAYPDRSGLGITDEDK